ncbi:hypothetical protein ACFVW8_15735 [Streptomyces sp. NPDC058221]|uniref:hypothetical protein n=1 Tax=Streptomyces sp. NPDC058221 TaxID=3346388 RepID=UPI0036E9D6AF
MRAPTALLTLTAAAFAVLLTTGTAHAADTTGTAGGYSFNSSTPLDRSVKRDLTVGDFHFWKISLKAGQRLDVKVSVQVPGGYDPGPSPHYERLGVRIYDPTRQPFLCDGSSDGTEMIYRGHATAQSGGTFSADCTIGTADYKAIARAGTYYVQAGIGGATRTKGDVLPLTVAARTGTGVAPRPAESWDPGTPAGHIPAEKPTKADSGRATDSSPTAATASSGLPPWALPGALAGGAIAALTLGAARHRPHPATARQWPTPAPAPDTVPLGPPPYAPQEPVFAPEAPPTHAPGGVPPIRTGPSFAVPGGPPAVPPGQAGPPGQDGNSHTR